MTSPPFAMITTSSTVWATSASTWLETSTVPPLSANARTNCRNQWTPSGSRPFAGSSRINTSGSPSKSARQTEALTHSEREALDPAVPDVGEVDLAEHRVDARERETCGGRQDAKVIARPPTGMKGVRLEHCPDAAERLRHRRVRLAADRGAALARPHQAEEHPQRRRLAGPVGPEEAGHGSFASGEAQVVDCGYLAEAF